jgi:nitrite reductase (NO-forming)
MKLTRCIKAFVFVIFPVVFLVAGLPQSALAQQAVLTSAPHVPPPVGDRGPTTVQVDLKTIETEGPLHKGVKYRFWTFDGTVPGPMVRVRVGDTVEFTLTNDKDSGDDHSIDIHAVTGNLGGGAVSQAEPGQSKKFTFKTLNPGLYIYHCATSHIPTHIANGMYGMMLVEPEGGLPKVDREYYVVQSEFYTKNAFGKKGLQSFSKKKALQEIPDYVVFNGKVGGVTGKNALTANVGETVRIYFGNAGPNLISSFHMIGEIWDRVWPEGSTNAPLENVQTTMVPVSGSSVVEFKVEEKGLYLLVDHSIFRAIDKGAAGHMQVH